MKLIDTNHRIVIVGLGLLGGSYARALSRQGYEVSAITLDQESIDYALSRRLIARGSTQVEPDYFADADLVIFALYPTTFVEWIEAHQQVFRPGTILTDVTGVKSAIVDKIQTMLRPDVEFIPAHPMAGREVSGVENSDDHIFAGANYVVTPTERNTQKAIELCEDLGRVLGFAHISRLSPAEHDEIIGFVSQLTHCLAMALMTCQQTEHLEDYTGDSFRDLTRIARMNEVMWSELFFQNKDALLRQMKLFEDELDRLKALLQNNDREGLMAMMRYSTERRALFDKKPLH